MFVLLHAGEEGFQVCRKSDIDGFLAAEGFSQGNWEAIMVRAEERAGERGQIGYADLEYIFGDQSIAKKFQTDNESSFGIHELLALS